MRYFQHICLLLLIAACGLPGAKPALADSMFFKDRDEERDYFQRIKDQKIIDNWKANRQVTITGLVKRGATEAEATEAVDDLISYNQQQIADNMVPIGHSSPKYGMLQARLRVLTAIANLGEKRFGALVKAEGLTPSKNSTTVCARLIIGTRRHPTVPARAAPWPMPRLSTPP